MFEQTAVFERGIGAVTDVVEKELFRIAPRTEEGESWALRPEPTAGIVRAYVQHGMQTWPQPVKLTTTGPMFRYDRPQAGRYRQFWQFDVEAIGDPGPAVDAEIIELGVTLLPRGRAAGRRGPAQLDRRRRLPARVHRGADRVLPRAHRRRCRRTERDRLERNAAAPARLEGPGDGRAQRRRAADHRPAVRGVRGPLRGRSGAPDAVGVRTGRAAPRPGLDYYTRTAFEFYVAGREGQQQAIGGGGRYDGLVELLGGKPTPGIGFGLGLDRVLLALAERASPRRPSRAAGRRRRRRPRGHGRRGCASPRTCGPPGSRVRADLARRKLGRQLEAASRDGAHFAVILGDELATARSSCATC